MTLTRRGWATLVLACGAVAVALSFGQPAMNAVAAPAFGALAYAAVSLWRTDPPTATVADVPPGYPDETRSIEIDLAGSGVHRVRHEWPAGLDGPAIDAIASPPASVETEVTLAGRGVYDLGELTVWRRDPLGLAQSPAAVDLDATVVVYPQVYRTVGGSALSPLLADDHRVERQAFDALREYRPGDPLRRIHWKSSAKHDDFLVTEFAPDRRTRTLTIAGDADPGHDDELATVLGTIALQALRAGLDVGVRVPDEEVPVGSGDAHRANLLGVLARVGHGSVPPSARAEADVSVRATREGTTVAVGSQQFDADRLLDGADARPIQEVASA